ncbi:MAG: DUF3592 domain-containing protein [Pirellulales bacterium]|nr:DUF3592 domain-containing protein [Pirellulales bacterium]
MTTRAKPLSQMSPRMRFFVTRIFPALFILVGAGALAFGVLNLIRAWQSTSWPTAEAVIQESQVTESRDNEGHRTYHPKIVYRFTVDGQLFTGDTVAFGQAGTSDRSYATGIVKRYTQGKKVSVSYSPDEPELCVLEPGISAMTWLLPGFGLVFFLAGNIMAIGLPHMFARIEPTAASNAPAEPDTSDGTGPTE